jgi:methanogenic corrinoid protein MtbC1
MTQEIIEMARDSGMELYGLGKDRARFVYHLEAFAKLVAEAERERIKQANAPEIEKINAHIEHAMQEVQRLGQEIEQEQLISDQINYGMSVTQGGKRIDPMSIYKEPEQKMVMWPC